MEDNIKEIIKSITISILAIVALVLIITIIFYNKISLGRLIPTVESYQLSGDAKNEVESEDIEQTEIVTTYILDATELKYYEKTKEYNKGKRHPFSENNNNAVDDEEGNFYQDEGK